jgi:2,4-didehydro-3-deoxy-L-rhamnonate hydrolase
MKLFRFGSIGKEKCGIQIKNELYDASKLVKNYDEKFFENDGITKLKEAVKTKSDSLKKIANPSKIRFGSAINRPSKIVCIGLNYAKHAIEVGQPLPVEPIVFMKAPSSFCGPNDDVLIPKNSKKTDWEVELAVIIGKKASYVDKAKAMDYVVGYSILNDYSEREFQFERGGQWAKGKSHDTFAPCGPFFVTKDEIKTPNNLNLWLSVNGKKMQDSNTNDMIFDVPTIIEYVSQFMTLMPGDVISTGTPFGGAIGQNPQCYLRAGDVVELGIEGLGTQKQVAKNWSK